MSADQPDDDAPALPPPLPAGAEQRAAPRFTLLLRSAKLVADDREFICVLRDASNTGVKVRLFHPLPEAQKLELELPEGTRHPLELVWERDGHAGFRFVNPVDVHKLIDDGRDNFPRRQLRVQVHNPARVAAHGDIREARILNISQQGACIECDEHLMLRERVRIEADLLPTLTAHVCWRAAPRYGLVFEQSFQLDELARTIQRVQQSEQARASSRSAA
ncbi:MAG: PilZ domain-containing protein [Sphingomonadales bacterium]|nr:PilZ domain-containing protein [Sphingomonadales bacterium]